MTMEFFLPEDNLNRKVPQETRITAVSVQPYPDGSRVRVNIEVTPFQKRPYIEISLTNSLGEEIASTSIVEPLSWKLEFTMHLHGEIRNPYMLRAHLYYPDGPSNEPFVHFFDMTQPAANPDPESN